MQDSFGRKISYLRLSVTDRCDFRCWYCLPRSHRDFASADSWLTPKEIERIVGFFAGLGVRHVRLTGGEPLVRKELLEISRRISSVDGIEETSLSTNAARFAPIAGELRDAGISRLNISLDSLDPDTFRDMTGGDLNKVLGGIDAAITHNFQPVKLNMVVMKGVNDHEVEQMIEFCIQKEVTLRFIETMPMGATSDEATDHYLDLQIVKKQLSESFELIPGVMPGGGPARYMQIKNTNLRIGFITPISQHFCETCNRVRLSVDGTLYLCLGQDDKVELQPLLRAGISNDALKNVLIDAIGLKPEKHEFKNKPQQVVRLMSMTGG